MLGFLKKDQQWAWPDLKQEVFLSDQLPPISKQSWKHKMTKLKQDHKYKLIFHVECQLSHSIIISLEEIIHLIWKDLVSLKLEILSSVPKTILGMSLKSNLKKIRDKLRLSVAVQFQDLSVKKINKECKSLQRRKSQIKLKITLKWILWNIKWNPNKCKKQWQRNLRLSSSCVNKFWRLRGKISKKPTFSKS